MGKIVKMPSRKFIAIDGINGSGKDTQINMLSAALQDFPGLNAKHSSVWITREPTDMTKPGVEVDNLLHTEDPDPKKAFKLLVKDRIEHSGIIKEVLNHSHVLASRYDLSTFIHQPTQLDDLSFKEVYEEHRYGDNPGCFYPDITFLLKISAETAIGRINAKQHLQKKDFFEKKERQQALAENAEKVIEWWRKNHPERNLIVIDAEKPIQEVHNRILEQLKKELIKD